MMKHILVASLSLLMVSGCTNVKQQLGIAKHAPDEFKVVKRAPLEMPADFTLPPPRPGAARPQEQAISRQVKESLLGTSATEAQMSQGEKVLLREAQAGKAPSDIRTLVDQETDETSKTNKPVFEKLTGINVDGKDNGNVIDPNEELKRLEAIKGRAR